MYRLTNQHFLQIYFCAIKILLNIFPKHKSYDKIAHIYDITYGFFMNEFIKNKAKQILEAIGINSKYQSINEYNSLTENSWFGFSYLFGFAFSIFYTLVHILSYSWIDLLVMPFLLSVPFTILGFIPGYFFYRYQKKKNFPFLQRLASFRKLQFQVNDHFQILLEWIAVAQHQYILIQYLRLIADTIDDSQSKGGFLSSINSLEFYFKEKNLKAAIDLLCRMYSRVEVGHNNIKEKEMKQGEQDLLQAQVDVLSEYLETIAKKETQHDKLNEKEFNFF